jgi:hypothetical protein
MNVKIIPAIFLALVPLSATAQEKSADTVIVPLAESSKIIFTVGDRDDLEILRHYDFQKLFEDILRKLEENTSTEPDSADVIIATEDDRTETAEDIEIEEAGEEWGDNDNYSDDYEDDHDEDNKWDRGRRGRIGQTWQSYNIDLGTNNYLADDQFPDASEPYSVRPWGSWYVAVNSVQRTRLGKNIFVEWALGVSWYNFKFQDDNILVQEDEFGVHFETDARDVDYIKSKLSATFINASLLPVLDFGDHSRKRRMWDGHGGGFRLGIGPYVGYRIASKSKLVYEADGEREREKAHDSFHLNNLRYGFRLQLGVRSTDLFVNYDMNDLFAEDKGPKLNALSFGLIF